MKIKKDWRGIIGLSAAYVVLCALCGTVFAVAGIYTPAVACTVMGGYTLLNTWIERKHWLE
jgi:hypothetical protein